MSESPGNLILPARDSASVGLEWNPVIFFFIKSPLGDSNDQLHLEAIVLENLEKLSKWQVLFLNPLFKGKLILNFILREKKPVFFFFFAKYYYSKVLKNLLIFN